MMRSFTPFLSALILISGCWTYDSEEGNGDDGYCALLNCTDLLHIYVERRDQGVFVSGEYRFVIEASTETPTEITCLMDDAGSLTCRGVPDGGAVETNSALSTLTIRLPISSIRVLINAYFDEREIGSELLEPDYEIVAQTDPSCPEELCYEGTATIKVIALE